jgi:SNF2 family DNA or RNA helicase
MQAEGVIHEGILIGADVRLSDRLDSLYLTPRDASRGVDIVRALKAALPKSATPRRSADGVRVSAEHAVEVAQGIPGLDLKWSVESKRFVDNRARAQHAYEGQLEGLRQLKQGGAAHARTLLTDSAGLSTLDAHQLVNVAAMTLPGGFGMCIFDEQGAGKTVTMIYAFDLLAARDEADFAVVVAPKSMIPEWPKDFHRFRGDLYKTVIVAGSRKEKRWALAAGADVVVTNFETAVSMEAEMKALLRSRPGRGVLVVDESFFIKSLDAKRTRAIRRLREWCGRAFVLCGTPAPNSPSDIVQQFSLVDFGLSFEGVDIPADRADATPAVQDVVDRRGLYLRHLKADVMDLPQKRFQRIYVPLEPVQRRLYEGALRDLIVDVESASDDDFTRRISNFLARRAALLQICSNPRGVSADYKETPAKLVALDGLLDRLVAVEREKVILWSFYTRSIDALVDRYARYGVLRYDGQVSDVAARREAVRRFQEDDDAMVFVANPAAAGAGLTLHRARIAIYESLSNQAAHYLQSLDRIHRRGQTREVEYLVLLGDGTIEQQEYERLVEKEAMAQALLRDEVTSPLTRETFLADVRSAAGLYMREARASPADGAPQFAAKT